MTTEAIQVRYRAATLTTRQFEREANPSIVNHRRIEAIMDSVRELAVLTCDEITGDVEEAALQSVVDGVLNVIEARIIGLATDIEAKREARATAAA